MGKPEGTRCILFVGVQVMNEAQARAFLPRSCFMSFLGSAWLISGVKIEAPEILQELLRS